MVFYICAIWRCNYKIVYYWISKDLLLNKQGFTSASNINYILAHKQDIEIILKTFAL